MRYRKPSWEIKAYSAASATLRNHLVAGWEPFAVTGAKVWIRRQVPRKSKRAS